MRVAIIHYWLVANRGGEKVLGQLCRSYPNATISTRVYDSEKAPAFLKQHEVVQTFVGRLPGAKKHCRKYLPLMPLALEQLDPRGFDLVTSGGSGPAKGVIAPPGVPHICY